MHSDDPVHFYRDLPGLSSFADVARHDAHADLPHDWWIAIADVAGSTRAIEEGDYKKVNTVGVACIAAVMNVDRDIDLPFIFGGDGATFAIPDSLRERVIVALRGAQQLAQDGFGLSLRVGLVRVDSLTAQDFHVRMGKVRLSGHVMQPVLSGRGWEEAERRVKSAQAGDVLRVVAGDGPADASFEGFECRWRGVPSFKDHKLALLVAATAPEAQASLATYRHVLEQIETIYGDVARYHPLRAKRMRMAFNPRLLAHEWRVRTSHLGGWQRAKYFLSMLWMNLAASYLFATNTDTREVSWSHYRDELVENSDFRKFDGMLRMVIDGSEAQAAQLQAFLADEFRQGRLAYGIHKSREALITCIVQSYNGRHQHFVDGSDGGYALAARELKKQLSTISGKKGRTL